MLFLAFILLYKLVFNVYTANFIITPFITKQFFQKPVQFEWERFSLFFGFGIKNLNISEVNSPNQKILSASKILVYYNLPLIFMGRLEISKILIQDLRLNIQKKENIWNISQVFKTSESPPKEDKSNQESLEEIYTFIPVSLGASIQVNNSSLEIINEDEAFYMSMQIPNFKLDLETKRENKIPLSFKILNLPKHFFLQIGEKENDYKLSFKTNNSKIETNFISFIQVLKVKEEQPLYNSELLFQTKDFQIQLPKENISTHVAIQYGLKFTESSDSLQIEKFLVLLGKETKVEVEGNVVNVFKSQEYFLKAKQFKLNLDELGFLLKKTSLVNFELGGIFDFSKLEFLGGLENLNIDLIANGNNLFYKDSNSFHSIKYLRLNSKAILNLVSQTPFLPYIQTLKVAPFELSYNSSNIKLTGNVDNSIQANLNLENF
ncbi:MAG: hypothetical protein N3A69_13640, partial [Leptospiraceae bacterium]|nr:hypothetical protein [Leptospiraceae bacterium]